jgi:hypothetical protein
MARYKFATGSLVLFFLVASAFSLHSPYPAKPTRKLDNPAKF